MEELNLHWRQTVPLLGEVLTEVAGNAICVEGWAPGEPPPLPETSGTAIWGEGEATSAEIDWEYAETLTLRDVRITCPPCPPATGSGRATYQSGTTQVTIDWTLANGVLTINDADINLLFEEADNVGS